MGSRADGLRLQKAGVDVSALRVAVAGGAGGGLAGLIVLAVAGLCGPGAGTIQAVTVGGGKCLQFRAPGSATFGAAQGAGVDGTYLLEDGESIDKWIRVQVVASYLPTSGGCTVHLADAYSDAAALGFDDVAAADALAGITETVQFTLKNTTGNAVSAVKLWLDATVSGFSRLSVSSDGVSFYTPTSAGDVNVLTWASIAAGASVTVWVKRVVAAAAGSSPAVLNALVWQWSG